MPIVYTDLIAEAEAEIAALTAELDAERVMVAEWTLRALTAEGELAECRKRNRKLRRQLDELSPS
jgi:hypothetical protein